MRTLKADEPAGFWLRVLALFLDYVILNLAFWGLYLSGWGSGGAIVWLAYHPTFESLCGGSPGKLFLRINVLTVEGTRLSLARSLFRTVSSVLSLILFGLGYLFAAFGEKRALHDYLSGAYVVRLPGSLWVRVAVAVLTLAFSTFVLADFATDTVKPRWSTAEVREQMEKLFAQLTGAQSAKPPVYRRIVLSERPPDMPTIAAPIEIDAKTRPQAIVGNISYDFEDVVALESADKPTVRIAFFLKKLSGAQLEEFQKSGNVGVLEPDVEVDLSFRTRGHGCQLSQLSSFMVRFNKRPHGISFPGTRPSVEFGRAGVRMIAAGVPRLECAVGHPRTITGVVQQAGTGSEAGIESTFVWLLPFNKLKLVRQN